MKGNKLKMRRIESKIKGSCQASTRDSEKKNVGGRQPRPATRKRKKMLAAAGLDQRLEKEKKMLAAAGLDPRLEENKIPKAPDDSRLNGHSVS